MNQICVKSNFTAGQVSANLFGRGDLRIFENGAKTLQNVIIHPTGGVSRRNGLRFIDELPSSARLIAFEFNTEQTYLLCLLNQKILTGRKAPIRCSLCILMWLRAKSAAMPMKNGKSANGNIIRPAGRCFARILIFISTKSN